MAFRVLPLQLADFEDLINNAKLNPGDDLVGPPTLICWPVSTPAAALSRATFHFAKQRSRFLSDPTVRYMKIVDGADPESLIISVARWYFYPHGYDIATQLHWELHAPAAQPSEMNIPLYNYILSSRDAARSGWQEMNEPCWILMHMVTLESQRGRGAAGLLVRWGIEQAERDGVPVYLEAGVLGKPVYEKYGFKQVGESLEVDLRPHGIQNTFVMCKMVYIPAGCKTKDHSTAQCGTICNIEKILRQNDTNICLKKPSLQFGRFGLSIREILFSL